MRRRALALILATSLTSAGLGMAFATTPVASANVCTSIPSLPVIPNPLKSACTVVSKGTGIVSNPIKTIGGIVTAPIKAVGDAVMKGVTDWVADGAAWLVGQAANLINQTTTPTLSAPWFSGQYKAMIALAAVFALPLLFLSILEGVLRRDGRIILRAACVQLPAAFILTGGAVVVVSMFLTLTDQMSAQITGSVSGDAKTFFTGVATALTKLPDATGTGVAPLFAVFLGGLIAAVGSFFVWIELLIRSAAIYVAVLFLPFTFIAMIWPQTAKWCRRLVEFLFAIVFSKFVIVAIMALAAAGLLSAGSGQGFNGVLAGAALLFLAAFSPMALLRLVPLVEGAAHASSHRSGVGSQTVGPVAGPAAVMRRVMDGNWGGGGGGGLRATPAAASGAARTATSAANGASGGGRSGGPNATPGQDGGRYAAVNGSTGSSGHRSTSGSTSSSTSNGRASSGPASARTQSPGHGSGATKQSGPASSSSTRTSTPAGGSGSGAPGGGSASGPRPAQGRQPPSTGPAASPGATRSQRPPAAPPRDRGTPRSNDQQKGKDQ
jgi:hypothetical protein